LLTKKYSHDLFFSFNVWLSYKKGGQYVGAVDPPTVSIRKGINNGIRVNHESFIQEKKVLWTFCNSFITVRNSGMDLGLTD
jgi:hypothetical protein